MKYAFLLGRNPELSLAELGSFFGNRVESAKNKSAAFFSGPLPAPPQDFLNRLGGTTEILEIFEENLALAKVETVITRFLAARRGGEETGKLAFALNLFPENKKSQLLKFLLLKIKKNLRTEGVSCNFLNKGASNTSPVAIQKQGVLKKGTNIWIMDMGESRVALGTTCAMQDFESYSKRDYGKPFRDARAGMLPPKLAQIMINLATIPHLLTTHYSLQTIIDPFCGTGTILMEALLMGHSVIGSDTDARMVEGAQKNIDWLRQMFPECVHVNTNVQLFKKDATALGAPDVILSARLPDTQAAKDSFSIATEPFLGPPLSQFPSEKFLADLTEKLVAFYEKIFKNLAAWLPKGTPVVFIFPYWKRPGAKNTASAQSIRLAPGLIAKLEALGYSKSAFVPLQTTSLFYERPDSVVGREIVRLNLERPSGRAKF